MAKVDLTSISSSRMTALVWGQNPSPSWGDGFFSLIAVTSVLAPIHPSLTGLLYKFNIPIALIFLIFWLPVLVRYISNRFHRRNELLITLPFVGYGFWLATTSIFSPAVGLENWFDSLRGVAILLPCVAVAALVGSKKPKSGVKIIIGFGFIALFHYLILMVIGGVYHDGNSGFGSIATFDEVQNYQTTSFYIGICGVFLLAISSAGFKYRWISIPGVLFVLLIMTTVGARAPMVGLLSIFLVFLSYQKFKKILSILVTTASLGVIVVLVYFMMETTELEEFMPALNAFERFSVLFDDDDSSYRQRLYGSALTLWLNSPLTFFFGEGLGSFPMLAGFAGEKGWYPHNFILETLVEGGLLALLFLTFPLFALFHKNKLVFREANFEKIFLFYFSIYSLMSFMFMGGLGVIWIPFFPWILFITLKYDK